VLERIVASSAQLREEITAIQHLAEQADTVSSELLTIVEQVGSVSQEAAASAEEVSASAEEVTAQVSEMAGQADGFKELATTLSEFLQFLGIIDADSTSKAA